PASMLQSASFSPALTDWTTNLGTFNKFNTTQGTLTGVVITETASMNLSGSGNKITSITETVNVSGTLPNSRTISATPSVSGGRGRWNLSNTAQASSTFTSATDLSAFTGTGTFLLPMNSLTTQSHTGRGSFSTTTTAGATITVEYDYTPPPP